MRYYYPHDNGGRPFKIKYSKQSKTISISKLIGFDGYEQTPVYDEENEKIIHDIDKARLGKHIQHQAFHPDTPNDVNSVLFEKTYYWDEDAEDQKFTFIFAGWEIYQFSLTNGDFFMNFYSQIGNNDVPYTILETTNRIYFLTDRKYIKKIDIPVELRTNENIIDGYSNFLYNPEFSNKAKKFRFKWIEKRNL